MNTLVTSNDTTLNLVLGNVIEEVPHSKKDIKTSFKRNVKKHFLVVERDRKKWMETK
jgi:small nuclear ribonucleoprotein (snRNP)-like protein